MSRRDRLTERLAAAVVPPPRRDDVYAEGVKQLLAENEPAAPEQVEAPPEPGTAFVAVGIVQLPGPTFQVVELDCERLTDGTVRVSGVIASNKAVRAVAQARFRQQVVRRGILK